MQNSCVKECLQQLLSVYVFAEQQYVHSATYSTSSLFQVFFRQRAFERSDLILQLQWKIDALTPLAVPQRTLEQFYELHNEYYGPLNLYAWPVVDIDIFVIDEKALEICNCFLNNPIPQDVYRLIEKHKVLLESSLLSFTYLRALDNNI